MKNILTILCFAFCIFYKPVCINAQFTDSLEIPDSLFYMMLDQDSVWDAVQVDSISNYAVNSSNNKSSCARTIPYTPVKDEILYNQNDRYVLFYSDDFNEYNTSFWKEIDNCSDECFGDPTIVCNTNNEQMLQYYKRANISIVDHYNLNTSQTSKVLTITAKEEQVTAANTGGTIGTFDYTSGFLKSKYGLPFENCIIEASIKLPANIEWAGLQPAFWLMGFEDGDYDELDIFEFPDNNHSMKTTIFKHSNSQSCYDTKTINSLSENTWHTYRCYWNKAFIAVQIDYKNWTYYRTRVATSKKGTREKRKEAIFTLKKDEEYELRDLYPVNPMRIMFNLYTYKCSNKRSSLGPFPQILEMDWIKIWYRVPCLEDLSLTNISQIPQQANVMNYIAGKNIYSNITQPLDDDIYLKVIHTGDFIGDRLEAGNNGYVEINPSSPDLCVNQSIPQFSQTNDSDPEILELNNEIIEISLFPNPSENQLTIKINGNIADYTIYISDIHNFTIKKLIPSPNSENMLTFSTSDLKDGVYYVQLKKGAGVQTSVKKLVVCRNNQ